MLISWFFTLITYSDHFHGNSRMLEWEGRSWRTVHPVHFSKGTRSQHLIHLRSIPRHFKSRIEYLNWDFELLTQIAQCNDSKVQQQRASRPNLPYKWSSLAGLRHNLHESAEGRRRGQIPHPATSDISPTFISSKSIEKICLFSYAAGNPTLLGSTNLPSTKSQQRIHF